MESMHKIPTKNGCFLEFTSSNEAGECPQGYTGSGIQNHLLHQIESGSISFDQDHDAAEPENHADQDREGTGAQRIGDEGKLNLERRPDEEGGKRHHRSAEDAER